MFRRRRPLYTDVSLLIKLVWLIISKLAIYQKPDMNYIIKKTAATYRAARLYTNAAIRSEKSMKTSSKKLILAALFAALTCGATMSVRIPTPGTGGYIHPGDAIVILCGVILGPVWGLLAAGIGSCLSDLLGGYLVYVPITFVIKGLIAFLSAYAYRAAAKSEKGRYLGVALGGVLDIALVTGGYFICEYALYGAGAAASIPSNLIQGISGLVLSLVLYPILTAVPDVRKMLAFHH